MLGAGVVAALGVQLAIPVVAYAAPGDASARGVILALDATAAGAVIVAANATVGVADAPPGGGTDSDTDLDVGAGTAGLVGVDAGGTVTSVTATRAAASSGASAAVSGASFDVLGVSALTAGQATATVTCPRTGALTADTTLAGLTLFGAAATVTANAPAATGSAAVTVAGLANAQLTVTVERVETTIEPDATAVAIRATLALDGEVLGVPVATIPVGTITVATASCQRPAAVPAPTASGIAPDSGPAAGGQRVRITGTGFVAGETGVTFDGAPATAVTVDPDGTALTAVTPAGTPGPAAVVVSTPVGDAAALDYTYLAAPSAPTVTGLTPDTGPTAGGTTVTITGTGLAGTTSVTFDGVPATIVGTPTPGSVTVRTPAHPAGPVDVVVTTEGGSAARRAAFTFLARAGTAPTATGLTPTAGPTTGGQTVVITGSGFVDGATSVTFDGVPAAAVGVVDADTLIVRTPPGAAGPADVVVTVSGVAAAPLGYRYVAGATVPATPTADGLDPKTGPTAGGTEVTVTGSSFVPGQTTVVVCDTTLPPAGVHVAADGKSLSFATPACAAGSRAVLVVTPGGTDATLRFTYTDAAGGSGVGGTGSGGSLPDTGADVGLVTLLGLSLVGAGALLARWGRRRRPLPAL